MLNSATTAVIIYIGLFGSFPSSKSTHNSSFRLLHCAHKRPRFDFLILITTPISFLTNMENANTKKLLRLYYSFLEMIIQRI